MKNPSGYTTTGYGEKEKIPMGYSKGELQQFTPEQMEIFKQMSSMLGPGNWLSKLAGGDEAEFEAIEAPQKRQFGEALGGMASKFSGMGMGGRKSSGFQNTMTSAASNFAQELGAQRQGLKSQAMKDLMEMSNSFLGQRPKEKFLTENPEEFGEKLALTMINAIFGAASKGYGAGG
jgi:hypothetical protein